MDAEELVELMQGYLLQYGEMGVFLKYCEEDCNLDKTEVEKEINKIVYGD